MKKAIVVGATSGIGRGLAKILAENDYLVGITGRRSELLERLRNENPGRFIVSSFDLVGADDVPFNLDKLVLELGGLDLLIISSGTGDLNEKLDFETEKRTIDLNVTGFTAVCDWSYNYFEKQKYGQLVGITSLAGLRGGRSAPSYNATKSYQISYLEGLRQKAEKSGLPISITDIRPGFVDTEMAKGEGLFWISGVKKAVRQMYRAIEKKRKIVYVTKRWRLIAVMMRILPDWIYNKI